MKKKGNIGFWKTVFKYIKSYKISLIIATVSSLLAGVLIAVNPIIIKHIIDDGIQNVSASNEMRLKLAMLYCGLFALVYLMRILVWGIGYRNLLTVISGFLFQIRSEFFNHVQNLGMKFYDSSSSGELFNYIMGSPIVNLRNFLQQFAMGIPWQVVALFISLGAMISYDLLLTVVMLSSVLITLIINKHSKKKLKKISNDLLKSESDVSKSVDDMLHGSRAIKMYAIENEINDSFRSQMGILRRKDIHASYNMWTESAKTEYLQNFNTALIYFVGTISCIYRGLTVGELVAFISSMGIVSGLINTWLNLNLVRSSAEASIERISSVLKAESSTPEKSSGIRSIDAERAAASRKGMNCIEFENVTFGYDNNNIFTDFNCTMERNKSYGLVGTSGSGKSTITKLIMRLYDVQEGEVKIYGRNIKDYSLHDLRKNIGIVPQDPFMFQTTILENVRVANPDAPMKEVIRAMETACVHEFVNGLPNGWNTIVGEGGYGISGGQKQRIAIARAILGKPDILIFDEATSALDNVSERYIQHAMEELMKNHTVIMIAHRLTTVQNVDQIYVFDSGKIIQSGNFEELSSVEGQFKNMLEAKIEIEHDEIFDML